MALGIYLNFINDSVKVIKFYEKVFNVSCNDLKQFKDMPVNPEYPISDEMKELVMNASLVIHGTKLMFSDVGIDNKDYIKGNNFTFSLEIDDVAILEAQFNELAKDGKVLVALEETFFASKYGYVIDKFGIGWQMLVLKQH